MPRQVRAASGPNLWKATDRVVGSEASRALWQKDAAAESPVGTSAADIVVPIAVMRLVGAAGSERNFLFADVLVRSSAAL
jgi:hypothetical protein